MTYQQNLAVGSVNRNPLTFQIGRYKEKKIFNRKKLDLDKKYSVSRKTKVVNTLGMHARPAAKIAQIAMTAQGGIWLSNGSLTVDASSIIDILTLCAVTGTQISIGIDMAEDTELAEEIKCFFDKGFGEEINE